MNRKKMIGYYIMILLPTVFLLALLAIFSFPLMLVALMALIVLVGILNRRKPEWFALFRKEKKGPEIISRRESPLHHGDPSAHTYMMLVGMNASRQPEIAIDNPKFTIGRDEGCNYQMSDPKVSGRHLTIEFNESDGLCYVTDTSTNGTFLNNIRLKRNRRTPLSKGDVLHISSSAFTVEYVHY